MNEYDKLQIKNQRKVFEALELVRINCLNRHSWDGEPDCESCPYYVEYTKGFKCIFANALPQHWDINKVPVSE